MSTLLLLCSLIPFYLLGAFPSGYLIARMRGVDITAHGSRNVGATNVARVIGKSAGIITLLCDIGKGALGVLLARILSADAHFVELAAIMLVAGHCFSIPGKLKGGKGVATALGVALALSPAVAGSALAIFLAMFAIWKIVSLASVSACLSAPVAAMLLQLPDEKLLPLGVVALIVTFRHRQNLINLANGTEKKMSLGKMEKDGKAA